MIEVKDPDEFIAELWTHADEVPTEQHPWFHGIINHRWTAEQIILGEIQHYHRVRTNPIHWGYIMINTVAEKRYDLMEAVLDNFNEELARPRTHVDIMMQMLEEGGISREEADDTELAVAALAAAEQQRSACAEDHLEELPACLILHGSVGLDTVYSWLVCG